MTWKQRPGYKELLNKISQAKTAISEKRHLFGPQLEKLVDEFMELKIGNAQEIWPLILELLDEIKVENYAGTHPPIKSIENNLNCELYIFVWDSKKTRSNMYLKFAIKNETFYYISLHKSNRPAKCWKFVDNFQRKR
ncbi:MAG: hypothetical protein V4487_04865 [Chlamydiota bacterium]